MAATIRCDECRKEQDTGDNIYCETCYEKLEQRIDELESENEGLIDDIKALKEGAINE